MQCALRCLWKDLQIAGKAYRVPIRTGGIAELNPITERPVSVDAINNAFRTAAAVAPLTGVMGVLEEGGPRRASSAIRSQRAATCR